jgi:hypothetical protein
MIVTRCSQPVPGHPRRRLCEVCEAAAAFAESECARRKIRADHQRILSRADDPVGRGVITDTYPCSDSPLRKYAAAFGSSSTIKTLTLGSYNQDCSCWRHGCGEQQLGLTRFTRRRIARLQSPKSGTTACARSSSVPFSASRRSPCISTEAKPAKESRSWLARMVSALLRARFRANAAWCPHRVG